MSSAIPTNAGNGGERAENVSRRNQALYRHRGKTHQMTTVAQVKQVVAPLLRRNPDLTVVGRLVVVKPVHHILRGILIGRSLDPKCFVPNWSAVFLFEPDAHFHLFRGTRMRGIWDISVPDLAEKLAEAIEREALPILRSIVTIDDFVKFANGAWVEDEKPYVDVARGDFEAAQAMCDFLIGLNGHYGIRQDECERVVQSLCPLIVTHDRPALARVLHEHEAASVKRLKLDKLWQPTPFPIELELNRA
jgi:hypothetical protein